MDRLLEKDITIKILSVFLAVVLWFEVTSERNPAVTSEISAVSITLGKLDPGFTVITSDPKTVDLRVRGRRDLIERLNRADFSATVDLRGLGAGERSVPVEVIKPDAVQLLDVRPSHVTVRLDVLVEKQVPVSVALKGAVGKDFRRGDAILRPTDVLVDGPRSTVEQVSKAVAEVDVSGATSDIVRAVPVRLVDQNGREVRGVALQPGLVEVVVPVSRILPSKTVSVRVSTTGTPASGYGVDSTSANPQVVKVTGPQEILDRMSTVDTRPVDVSGSSGELKREVGLAPPADGVTLEPDRVTVTVRFKGSKR